MKRCITCKIEKEDNDFHVDARLFSSRKSKCKLCYKEITQKYYASSEGKEKHREYESLRRKIYPEKTLFHLAKQRAKKHKLEFSISESDIVIPENCPVLGIKLSLSNSKLSNNSPTLDRVDPSKGYVKENIKVISWRANRLKSDASLEEIEKIVYYLYKNTTNYRDNGVKRSQRPTRFYTYQGESMGLIDWAEKFGINYNTLNNRVHRLGWEIGKAINTPVRKHLVRSKN
jgi:hypothetical protein